MIIGFDGRPANEENRVGIGNYCAELLRALVELEEDTEFRVYLDREPTPGFPLSKSAVDIRVLPSCRGWTQRALAKELRREPPDVFFSSGIQIPLRAPCPSVPTLLDLAYFTFPECFTWRMRALNRLYTRIVIRRAAHVLTISEATKRDVVRLLGVPPQNVTVTHLGVASSFYALHNREEMPEIRRRMELPEHYVLYVGTLQPRKNLVRLIAAFGELRKFHPELPHHLILAGKKGWLYDDIFRAAERSPAHQYIRFLDFVSERDLAVLMGCADALALVSLSEGFGLPVVEAMLCGTAVLASNCSSLPEVTGDAAVLVEPSDVGAIREGLERILLDATFRASLESRGRERAAGFTWERTARATLDVLWRVVSGARQ